MEFYNAAVNMFIRPPRATYTPIELGPSQVTVATRQFIREDIILTNGRGLKIRASHFLPPQEQRAQKLPCIVYLHGNCGCRLDALEMFHLILGMNISLFCLDFSGSGLSEGATDRAIIIHHVQGDYISLGFYEKDDVVVAFQYLRSHAAISTIGIWGMSMGAATALWFSALYPDWASCLIVDSPFAKLTRLAGQLVKQQESKAPKWLLSGATSVGLKMVRKSIKSKAKFDIRKNTPVDYIHTCKAPVLFGHAETDKVIPASHSAELFEKYPNIHKRFITFPGDHNTLRPAKFYDAAARFLFEFLLEPAHRQIVPAPLKPMGNTAASMVPNCWLVRRQPVNQEDAVNIPLADALCLLIIDRHGVKTMTPFTEQPIQSIKWYMVAVYWSVGNHFCVDYKGADKRHGRWIFATLESEDIMDATKKTVVMLKPRSKKKLLMKGPTAEGLENVAKGIKAFSPKSQVQLEVRGTPAEHNPRLLTSIDSPVSSASTVMLENEEHVRESMRNLGARRVEKVGIMPKPDEQLEDPEVHAPAAALPWELYSAMPVAPAAAPVHPTAPVASASSPALMPRGPKEDVGGSGGISRESSMERRNTYMGKPSQQPQTPAAAVAGNGHANGNGHTDLAATSRRRERQAAGAHKAINTRKGRDSSAAHSHARVSDNGDLKEKDRRETRNGSGAKRLSQSERVKKSAPEGVKEAKDGSGLRKEKSRDVPTDPRVSSDPSKRRSGKSVPPPDIRTSSDHTGRKHSAPHSSHGSHNGHANGATIANNSGSGSDGARKRSGTKEKAELQVPEVGRKRSSTRDSSRANEPARLQP